MKVREDNEKRKFIMNGKTSLVRALPPHQSARFLRVIVLLLFLVLLDLLLRTRFVLPTPEQQSGTLVGRLVRQGVPVILEQQQRGEAVAENAGEKLGRRRARHDGVPLAADRVYLDGRL